MAAVRAFLAGGRMHLQHRPIDLVIEAQGAPAEVRAAYDQAWESFQDILETLVAGESCFTYRPKSKELARCCDLLAESYVGSRQALLGFVATESRRSVKRFADAFRLSNPEEDK